MAILNAQKIIDEIAQDNMSGAVALTVKAIEVYLKYIEDSKDLVKDEFLDGLINIGKSIQKAQPSIVSISNVVSLVNNQLYSNVQRMTNLEVKHFLSDYLNDLKSEILDARKKIAQEALKLIPPNAVVITISESSTVEEIIRLAFAKGRVSRIILPESRPLLEGINMAEKLLKIGVAVTVIVDAALGFFCKEADLAIVGADTVQKDGSILHKVGTYPLALACYDLKKPFYVACDSLKFSKTFTYNKPAEIVPKCASEIINPKKLTGADIRNVYFDITPAKYVTRLITEKGTMLPKDLTLEG